VSGRPSPAADEPSHHRPIWDRGAPIDAAMLRFTIGDDWQQDRRLVEVDLQGSLAHAAGLERAGLIGAADAAAIRRGLEDLLAAHRAGRWDLGPEDEDVHSAVERRLTDAIGAPAGRLHTGRSRNEQIALDLRLWLRAEIEGQLGRLGRLADACRGVASARGALPLPGYTHLRRAMPSSVGDWASAHARAFELDREALSAARLRLRECPLGSGAGYGVPLALARGHVAELLGFERPEEPVTLVQHARGRAELDYATALEGLALDLGKLAADLWLYTTAEFGFARLPPDWTTGSSMMPHKRNPDVLELARAHARQLVADRAALLEVVRDLPSGYHRDFQLLKPPLFRAADRARALLEVWIALLPRIEWDEAALAAACSDEALTATRRALEAAEQGVPFREAYRRIARDS
jgi:argininosuccinate lyase